MTNVVVLLRLKMSVAYSPPPPRVEQNRPGYQLDQNGPRMGADMTTPRWGPTFYWVLTRGGDNSKWGQFHEGGRYESRINGSYTSIHSTLTIMSPTQSDLPRQNNCSKPWWNHFLSSSIKKKPCVSLGWKIGQKFQISMGLSFFSNIFVKIWITNTDV